MSPLLQRQVRALSTTLVVVLALIAAGGLASLERWYETSRAPKPSPCSAVLDEVFAHTTDATSDASLLERLLQHRRDCIHDPEYADQVRRLMLNLQQVDQARSFLEEARRTGTFTPDEFKLQLAWVDLTAAQVAWTNGQQSIATNLYGKAVAAAREVRDRWPEWSLPYRILAEASDYQWAKSSTSDATDYAQLERNAQGRVLNGAIVRSFSDWQPIVYVFIGSLFSVLGLCAALNGSLAIRTMNQLVTSSIATASAGYVELKGTLHLVPGTTTLISPFSKRPSLWYDLSTRRQVGKHSQTSVERSTQSFLFRDASGEAVVDPREMTVRTIHRDGKFVSSSALRSGEQIREKMLEENDAVYVRGELVVEPGTGGLSRRTLRIAENGRPLLVSTYTKEQLLSFERLWLGFGLALFALCGSVLIWSFFERYHVIISPGRLS